MRIAAAPTCTHCSKAAKVFSGASPAPEKVTNNSNIRIIDWTFTICVLLR